jgi:hypothetical protein
VNAIRKLVQNVEGSQKGTKVFTQLKCNYFCADQYPMNFAISKANQLVGIRMTAKIEVAVAEDQAHRAQGARRSRQIAAF